jgi:hypothetical protein
MSYTSKFPWPVISGSGVSNFFKGANVTSASTIVPTGNLFNVTGSTTITAIDSTEINAGASITMVFAATCVVQHGSLLQLFASSNFNALVGDRLTLIYDGTAWYEIGRRTASTNSGGTSFQVSGARSAVTTNVYSDTPGSSTSMNIIPFVMPYNSYLETMMISSQAASTWTAEIHVGGVLKTGATLPSAGAQTAYSSNYSAVAIFSAGDKVAFYNNGTSINRPYIWALFRKA